MGALVVDRHVGPGPMSRITSDAATYYEALRARAEDEPDRTVFSLLTAEGTLGDGLTYGALDRRARAVAALLREQWRRGDRALLMFPPGLDYIVALFGCFYAGVIAVPVYPPRANRSLERLLS